MSLSNCYNLSNINSKNKENFENYVGGIIGNHAGETIENMPENNANIDNCYNKGNIEGGTRLGGIIGLVGKKTTIIINRCYNTGNITVSIDNGELLDMINQ